MTSLKAILNPLRNPVVAATMLGVLVLATVAVKARGWRNFKPEITNSQQLITTTGPAQLVRFTVYDAGIFPKEVRVSAGSVVLRLEDMSGASAGLLVTGESLQTMGQVVRRPHHWRENARISLSPGRYTVFDPSRPANRARLIVEP